MSNWLQRYQATKEQKLGELGAWLRETFPCEGQKGGPGSGHHGHAGRPGKRGGSAPGPSPFAKPGSAPAGMSTGHYDEVAERDVVLEVRGQSSNPKPGITREQMQRFYARRNAVQAARSTRYRKGNQTVSQAVDDAISQGMTHYSASSRWTTLTNPSDRSQALRFSGRIERDYIKVVLGRGEFKRNY